MARFPETPSFRGLLEPTRFEGEVLDVEVSGAIPPGHDGAFYRVHPDPQFPPRLGDDILFNGDGSISMFRFESGRVDFRQKWVRTDKFNAERAAGKALFGAYRNPLTDDPSVRGMYRGTANTNVLVFAKKLWALKEDSPPVLVDPLTLDTEGYTTFDGKMTGQTFTAHPKVDPTTGDLIAFGYGARGLCSRDVAYYEIGPDGALKRELWFEAPYYCMMHDFAVTADYAVFLVVPNVGSIERLEKRLPHFGFDTKLPVYVGVLPRREGATGRDVRWFKRDNCFASHVMNAFQEGSKIHIDTPEAKGTMFPFFPDVDGKPFDPVAAQSFLTRWTIDLESTTDHFASIERRTQMFGEFPRIDDRRHGLPYRHGWLLVLDESKSVDIQGARPGMVTNTLGMVDLVTGREQKWWCGPTSVLQEPCFIPRGSSEGDGWIVQVCNRVDENRSDLLLFDALEIAKGPIAVAKLPIRLRTGFHGTWAAARDIVGASAPRRDTPGKRMSSEVKPLEAPRRKTETGDVAQAIREWGDAVGADHVVTDAASLGAAETATFATTHRVVAIVRPRDRAEVQACVRVANATGVPLYPVSRGKNWGYGSRVPTQSLSAILDLSRLDRILEFDERLGYAVVEPGVTFAQLDAFLRQRGSRLRLNFIGGSRQASVLGNALERGIGVTIDADRAAHVCAMEVVLGNGDCIHTGMARHASSRTGNLRRSALGPDLDGLFLQSSFGIVTKLTQWLSPAPEAIDHMEAAVAKAADLAAFVDAVQPLCLSGAIRGALKLINDYRLISMRTQYPWDALEGARPMTPSGFRDAGVVPAWLALMRIDLATASFRAPTRDLLQTTLGSRASLRFVEVADPVAWSAPDDVGSAYWRKRKSAPKDPDPDRDRCGAIFVSPILPFVGSDVARAVDIVETTALAHGFEPFIALTALDGRAVHMVAPLFFDRDDPGEDEKALKASRAIMSALIAAGYFPYRMPIDFMDVLPAPDDDVLRTVASLRDALDPEGILAPGRYDLGKPSSGSQ